MTKQSNMKKLVYIFIPVLFILQSCIKDQTFRKTTLYRPVYKTKQEVWANIKSSAPEELSAPGKIYFKDGFVFLNELNKGVHIIDVRNPSAPQNIAFIHIPGAVDLAVRGNILYADMYTDLIAVDIANPQKVKLSHVEPGVFPRRYYSSFIEDTSRIITEWVAVDTVIQDGAEFFMWGSRRDWVTISPVMSAAGGDRSSNGTGGSMARFALSDDRLYTVGDTELKVFNVAVPEKPSYIKEVSAGGWGIETIFPFGKNLFIGSMNGMYIFDISSKNDPKQIGTFVHARVCDPVITDGKHAFVTLRNGSKCAGYINQLDVVDIADMTKPVLVKSYPLTNPHGLSKEDNILVICDGADGVKFFDATNAGSIRQLSHIKGMNAFDVIALGRIAMVSAEDALYLIDFNDPVKPIVKSTISIKNQ